MLAVLALSHVPADAAWTGTSADTVSGSKIVAMPVAKRLPTPGAGLDTSVVAVLPPLLVLTLLVGFVAALVRQTGTTRRGARPRPGRGPPLALR